LDLLVLHLQFRDQKDLKDLLDHKDRRDHRELKDLSDLKDRKVSADYRAYAVSRGILAILD
jgi:hypothetical protein